MKVAIAWLDEHFGERASGRSQCLYRWSSATWLAFGAALLTATILSWHALTDSAPLLDEAFYLRAFSAAREGTSLHRVEGWYYPDLLARIAILLADPLDFLKIQRVLNLLGTALTVGVCAQLLARRWAIPLAVALVFFYTPVQASLLWGNVSGLLVGLIVLAAGAGSTWLRVSLLVPGALLKPYALGVVATRPWREIPVPLLAVALAVANTSGRGQLVNLGALSNASLMRSFIELGIPIPWMLWTVVVLVVGAFWARGSWSRGFCIAWATLPITWEHTTLLLLPPLALAFRHHLGRAPSPQRTLRLLTLCAAGLVLHKTRHFAWPDGPDWFSGLLGLVPSLAVLIIAVLTADPERLDPSPDTTPRPTEAR
jgi:hypothetical protein